MRPAAAAHRWLQIRPRGSGVADASGEIDAESLAAGDAPLFYSETVELVPDVRRTLKATAVRA